MAKKIVRLTESQLHKVITESVQRILREMDEDEIAAYEAFENEMLDDNDVYQKICEIVDNKVYDAKFPLEKCVHEIFDDVVTYYANICDTYDKEAFLKLLDEFESDIYKEYVEPFLDRYYGEEHDPEDIANWQRAHYRDEGWF